MTRTRPRERPPKPARWRRFARATATALALLGVVLIAAPGSQARVNGGAPLAGATVELFKAVEVNDMPGVKAALAAGADVNAKNASGKTAADLAVDRGHFIIAHFLLSQRRPAATPAAKPQVAAPRRLRPRPAAPPIAAAPKSATQRRFTAPPAKPAAAESAAKAPAPAPHRAAKRRFAVPPPKPTPPLAEAVSVAEAPGRAGEPPTGTDMTGADMAGADMADADADMADAPLATPPPDEISPGGAPEAEAADSPARPALGPVGEFFQRLVDLVRPDQPEPGPAGPPADVADAPQTGPADVPSPEISDAPSSGDDLPAVISDRPDAADDLLDEDIERQLAAAEEGETEEGETQVDDVAALAEPGPDETARVRRIDDNVAAIRRGVPAPPTAPEPEAPLARSTSERTLDRIGDLVGDQPREDEFGLPEVRITGTEDPPPGVAPEPGPERMAEILVEEEPSLDSLLGDDAPEADLPPAQDLDAEADGLPALESTPESAPETTPETTLERMLESTVEQERGPNVDDPPGPEPPSESIDKDEGLPRAAPAVPVETVTPPGRRRPRFMSTAERLRLLNEALSREVPLDAPTRQRPTVADKVTDYMITGMAPEKSRAKSTMPPSTLPTRPLSRRPTPSDRFVDRLERIRRNAYDEAAPADPPPSPPAAAVPVPARPAPPAAPPPMRAEREPLPAAAAAREDTSALGKLVDFFKSADARADTRPKPVAPQPAYRDQPRRGLPATAMVTPEPVAPEAVAEIAAEPKPGQTAGKMTPGFMENLSRLFTDEKVAEKGWAAEVEIMEPKVGDGAPPEPLLRPVAPSATTAETPLPPLSGEVPADAGGAWTTTVEMNTDTGEPMVLGVLKTPVPPGPRGATPPRAGRQAPAARPPGEDDTVRVTDDSLPPAEGETIEVTDNGLPPAEGEAIEITDDGLPPAEGEALVAAPAAPASPGSRRMTPAAAPPYGDPLRRPDPNRPDPAPAPPRLARAAELKPGPGTARPAGASARLRPDEALATGAGEPRPGQSQAAGTAGWTVTKLDKADAPPPRRARAARPQMLSRTSLTGVNLALGESVSLENTLPPGGGIDADNECVKKNRGTTLFCIEPVDWPDDIRPKFVVPTILYTGPMAIVRYDQGTASRLHALFPSAEFDSVAQYYQQRYGPPTEIWKRSIAPLAQPRRENPTLAWRNRDPKTNAVTILEIRRFDDTRGSFPDTQRGAVMLYLANSPAIFPQVSSHELMRLKREAAKAPAEG